ASPAHNGKAKAPHGAKSENKYENMLYIMIGLAWLIALSLKSLPLVMAVTANRFQTSKAA
ncbi:MAG: hypothetical protein WBV51_13020, partial [Pseudolabrys sp.]